MKTDYYKMTDGERKEATTHYLTSCSENGWSNPNYLKVGDKVWYMGYNATSYRLFEVVEIWDNRDILREYDRL